MARPTKLTPEVQAKIVEAVSMGNYREVAAEWVGIGEDTFSRWMSRPREPYLSFRQAVLEAERAAEIRAVELIMRAAADDPKHAEWWLERKFHDRWGRKENVNISGRVTSDLSGLLALARESSDYQLENRPRPVLPGRAGEDAVDETGGDPH